MDDINVILENRILFFLIKYGFPSIQIIYNEIIYRLDDMVLSSNEHDAYLNHLKKTIHHLYQNQIAQKSTPLKQQKSFKTNAKINKYITSFIKNIKNDVRQSKSYINLIQSEFDNISISDYNPFNMSEKSTKNKINSVITKQITQNKEFINKILNILHTPQNENL